MLDVSRGWLTSAFVASSTELAETLTVNLTSGKWESIEVNELGEKVEANGTMIDCFVPDNSGMAMLVSSTAKVFALRLKNQPNSIVANRLIPTGKSELIAREYSINPNYIENGFINTYVQDWEALDNKIQREEITQKAFYSQYTPEYESNVPLLDEISRRNFFNVYSWNGGNWYHRETAFTGVTGMEVGGRFDLLGMAGVSAGDPLFDTWNLTMMFGIHEDITVMKGEDSSYTAKMHVDFQADMLDHVKKELKPQIDSYRWQTYYLESSAEHFDKFYQKVVDPDWLVNSTDPDAAGLRNAMDARKPVWRILHRVTWLSAYGALEAFSSPTANALKGAGVQSPYQLTQRVQTDGLDSLPLDADARSEVEAYLSELDWNRPPT
jgi:hypothetical protein